jgi:hypothetical protein
VSTISKEKLKNIHLVFFCLKNDTNRITLFFLFSFFHFSSKLHAIQTARGLKNRGKGGHYIIIIIKNVKIKKKSKKRKKKRFKIEKDLKNSKKRDLSFKQNQVPRDEESQYRFLSQITYEIVFFFLLFR